jgi:hypothetical protein
VDGAFFDAAFLYGSAHAIGDVDELFAGCSAQLDALCHDQRLVSRMP